MTSLSVAYSPVATFARARSAISSLRQQSRIESYSVALPVSRVPAALRVRQASIRSSLFREEANCCSQAAFSRSLKSQPLRFIGTLQIIISIGDRVDLGNCAPKLDAYVNVYTRGRDSGLPGAGASHPLAKAATGKDLRLVDRVAPGRHVVGCPRLRC